MSTNLERSEPGSAKAISFTALPSEPEESTPLLSSPPLAEAVLVGNDPQGENVRAAKEALYHVERITADLAADARVRTCFEQWMSYGEALLAQRRLMPNKRAFGAWVKENALDVGIAKSAVTRSDAIWMAMHKADLNALKSRGLRNHHPSHIRQEMRDYNSQLAAAETPDESEDRREREAKAKAEADAIERKRRERAEKRAQSAKPRVQLTAPEYLLLQACVDPERPRPDADKLRQAQALVRRFARLVVKPRGLTH